MGDTSTISATGGSVGFTIPPVMKKPLPGDPTAAAMAPQVIDSMDHPDGSSTVLAHVPAPISAAVKATSTAPKIKTDVSNPAPAVPAGAGADGTGGGAGMPPRGAKVKSEQSVGTPSDNDMAIDSNASQSDASTVAGITSDVSKPELPSLAPQGGGNAFTRAISRFVGLSKGSPEPGKPYTGPVTSDEKQTAGMKFAGRIGNAMAAVGGTPEQQQIAEQRSEFGPKTEMEMKALNNEQAYRTAVIANSAQKNTISEEKNDISREKNDSSMRVKGYVPSETGSGYRPMNENEILSDPLLSQNQKLKEAAVMSKQAQGDLAKAHTNLIMDPTNPTFQQKEREIQARLKMAQAHLAMEREGLGLRTEAQAMKGREDSINLGLNTQTEAPYGTDSMPVPTGALVDPETGLPIPKSEQSLYAPTTTSRNAASQAKIVKGRLPSLIAEIQQNADSLGPVMGRWGDFIQGKVGAEYPEFAGVRTDLTMMATAVALMHARGRLPDNLRKEFNDMINAPQQDPRNIITVLQHLKPWVDDMANAGVPNEYKPKTPIHNAATAGSSGGSAKTATKAHVSDYATQKGISVDAATKEFTDAGFTVR